MKTKTKVLALALSAVLLIVCTVCATVAFLTASDSVTNTFTFGQVAITLDEADVEPNGTYVAGASVRTDANVYHLIPGHTYIKDPVVHVDSKSEDCWLFVKLENGLKPVIAETTIEAQMTENGNWTCIDEADQIYAYKSVCEAGANVATFGTFTLTDDANVSDYGDAAIKVTAYAVQEDGFATAQDAWDATFGK